LNVILITGSCGLIGSESVNYFSGEFDLIIGLDNDMRSYYFGQAASIDWNRKRIEDTFGHYQHYNTDIREKSELENIVRKYGDDIKLIIHTAAQPSHDWAAREPHTDFSVNALGTLNILESMRKYCPNAVFIFTSTNKVYGDLSNQLPLLENKKRYELNSNHTYYKDGIDESMSIDQSKHSLFGASKLAADVMVQEYGQYFGIKSAIFRGGCLTGPLHSGAELHGFLAYLIYCALSEKKYTIFGYKGKQVRDNIHSRDLITMFDYFYKNPKSGEVYNTGGGRFSNCSILEAIDIIESILNKKVVWDYDENHRSGDHIWWISNVNKFKSHYPQWKYTINLPTMIEEIGAEIDTRLSI